MKRTRNFARWGTERMLMKRAGDILADSPIDNIPVQPDYSLLRRARSAIPSDIPEIEKYLNHPKCPPRSRKRLTAILGRLNKGQDFRGSDYQYYQGVKMVLYAKTPTLEDIIFEIRKYLIETKCNVTETAARMCWKRPDVWSIIEENAHAFGDLLETVRIDTNLMKRMEAASRKETIERALKIANGRVSIAAGILGIKRSTLQERIAELMISCHRESLDDASARSADNN